MTRFASTSLSLTLTSYLIISWKPLPQPMPPLPLFRLAMTSTPACYSRLADKAVLMFPFRCTRMHASHLFQVVVLIFRLQGFNYVTSSCLRVSVVARAEFGQHHHALAERINRLDTEARAGMGKSIMTGSIRSQANGTTCTLASVRHTLAPRSSGMNTRTGAHGM